MPRPEPTDITIDQYGAECHESFALAGFSRVTATPGQRLFDSSIPHNHFITLSIKRATRKREVHRDWLHGTEELIEVGMSEAQFGAMVSSFNVGDGTPVTILRFHDAPEVLVPEPTHNESRLAETAREVQSEAQKALSKVEEAAAAVADAFERKAGRREMAALLNDLTRVVGQAPSNMRFAADSLTEHTEKVITKARADVEAMVIRAAEHAALDSGEITEALGLGSGEVIDADVVEP